MKFKKVLSLMLSFLLIATSITTFYLGFKGLDLNSEWKTENNFLNKINFASNEWKSVIDKNAKIDILKFKILFLRKLKMQADVNKIEFQWNDSQVVVKLIHGNKHYSWFYNLQKKFVI